MRTIASVRERLLVVLVGRDVEGRGRALERARDRRGIAQIAGRGDGARRSLRRIAHQRTDGHAALREERAHDLAADRAGRAADEDGGHAASRKLASRS
jgi:hypothetical protein